MISWVQIQTALERYGPRLLFIIGAFISLYVSLPVDKLYLNAIATVCTLMASLTGVSIGVLLALQTDVANALQKKGYYKILMGYARASVFSSLLTTLIALAGFFITDEYENLYKLFLFGMILYSVGAFYRVMELLLSIGGFHRSPQ